MDVAAIKGVRVFEGPVNHDDRGNFLTIEGLGAFADNSPLQLAFAQNDFAGTIRGLHFQRRTSGQQKLIWCAAGSLVDFLVDARLDSPSYGKWQSIRLKSGSGRSVYVPAGVAHGYQTLEDDTTVGYLISGHYSPADAQTLKWDDPWLNLPWPLPLSRASENDLNGAEWPVEF